MAINPQTKNPTKKVLGGDKTLRFTGQERLAHWVHAVAFFILLFTGLSILGTFFAPVAGIFGGLAACRLIHRVVAVISVVVVLLLFFVGDTKGHWYWIKAVFTWGKADIQHIMTFPQEFFGGNTDGKFPPQDKYNGGEKINSLLTIFGSFFIAISGFIMWFAPHFPAGLVRWAYPVHDLAAFIMATAITGHMYLAIIHPKSNPALKGIITGYVKTSFAKHHYGKWYDRIKNEQNLN
ncbi:MAG: formate dehydrogenase subunit gamma [Desulfosporosinus sp.]|jgi:formate dehydrogenase subunit gamma